MKDNNASLDAISYVKFDSEGNILETSGVIKEVLKIGVGSYIFNPSEEEKIEYKARMEKS